MKEFFTMTFLAAICAGCSHDTSVLPEETNPYPVCIQPSSHIQTRVSENHFDKQDSIGLFILKQPNTLAEERHADNQHFIFDGTSWNSNTQLYYPDNTSLCDFIAYYPYRSNALATGSTKLTCTIASDQSQPARFTQSDLLIAERLGVTPSPDPVALVFKHKLAEVCIELEYGTGFNSAQELLASGPSVSILGSSLEGEYDLETRQVTSHRNPGTIIPAGTFRISENKVVGKQAIILPQTIAGDHPFIEVMCGGKKFVFTFGENHTINPATRETYTLTLRKAAHPATIHAEISDWDNSTATNGELLEEENTPDPASGNYVFTLPDFSESSVYQCTLSGGYGIELCKEYLLAGNIQSQAIVAYPIINNQTDLNKGYVLQLNEATTGNAQANATHGGKVTWNSSNNTLEYTPGTDNVQTYYYYSTEQGITNQILNAANTLVFKPVCINDSRDGQVYPIVKIATQYWMQKDLKAEKTVSGTVLTDASDNSTWSKAVTEGKAAYGINKGVYYYTANAMKADILPEGWSIPDEADWKALMNYTTNVNTITTWGNNITTMSISMSYYRKKDGTYSTASNTAYYWHTKGNLGIYSSYNFSYLMNEGACIRGIRE